MELWNTFTLLLDTICITPYRMLPWAEPAFWLGTTVLSLWCIVAGEFSGALVYLWNRDFYDNQQREMVRMHNLSVEAIRHKDKATYKASNRWANEYFGKVFFSGAALFAVSLWPVPFALGWLDGRFRGIELYHVPFGGWPLGYAFVFFATYIPLRILFSRVRDRMPFFRRVARLRKESAASIGDVTSWSELAADDDSSSGGEDAGNADVRGNSDGLEHADPQGDASTAKSGQDGSKQA